MKQIFDLHAGVKVMATIVRAAEDLLAAVVTHISALRSPILDTLAIVRLNRRRR